MAGGGSSSSDPTPSPAPAEETTAVNLQVIDGYLKDAEVFADLNRNFVQDDNEPSAMTDENGLATLNIPKDKLRDLTSIKIISKSKKGSTNTILGKQKTLDQDLVMTSNVYLENLNSAEPSRITPFTTLADSSITSQPASYDEYKNQIKKVSESIGVDIDVALSDYNNKDNLKKEHIAALTAGELIVRSNLLPQSLEETKNRTELQNYSDEMITGSLEQYKEIVEDSKKIEISEGSDVSTVIDKVVENIESTQETLSKSLRNIASGAADEWRCGVTKSNNVYCWGNNSWGTLGDPYIYPIDESGKPVTDGRKVKGNFSAKPVAVKIKQGDEFVLLTNIKNVAMGNIHACAVSYTGEVYCWGGNYKGQLGVIPNDQEISAENGNEVFLYAQKVLKGQQKNDNSEYLSNVDYLQLGQNHSCALTKDGEVYCWGLNSSYELGADYGDIREGGMEHRKDITNHSGEITLKDWMKIVQVPVKLPFPESVKRVNFLSSGLWAHCALVENKDPTDRYNMYCWGSDRAGTISHNYKKYKEDFEANFQGKHLKANEENTYTMKDYWNWYLYEPEGDWHPLYGQPVTQIKSYYLPSGNTIIVNNSEVVAFENGCFEKPDCFIEYKERLSYDTWRIRYREKLEGSDFPMTDLTFVSLTEFDGKVYFTTKNKPGKLYGTWGGEYWDTGLPEEVTDIRKIYSNVEEDTNCLLLGPENGEQVYCQGRNEKRLLGNGSLEKISWGYGFVLDSNYDANSNQVNRIRNVKSLSMNKRSVCATVADDDSNPYKTSLYCWGSSIFGQMGFDNNQDNDVSYYDMSLEWKNGSSDNKYIDDQLRIEAKPRKIQEMEEFLQ
ncbi:MAG: RCC1 domain-containing protein [Succinivibrionaceae bacterium]